MKQKLIINGLVLVAVIGLTSITTVLATNGINSANLSHSKVYLNDKEISLANPLVSIARDGQSDVSTYIPAREFLENMGYAVEWNSADDSIHLSPAIVSSPLSIDILSFPLIAVDDHKEAFLYAIGEMDNNQSILKFQGISKVFNWIWTTPRTVLPRMQVFDYDKNGEKEVAISLNSGSGTGISVDELHVVKAKDGDLVDCKYNVDDYMKQIPNSVTYKVTDDKGKVFINLSSKNSNANIDITDYAKEIHAVDSDIKFAYGDIIEFTPKEEGKIELRVGLGIYTEQRIDPMYIADLKANVTCKDEKFTLSNFQINKY